MQLTAAAVTPPAEHAARRPAEAADAAAADADVSLRGGAQKYYLFSDYFSSPFQLRSGAVERGDIEGLVTRIAGSVRVALRYSFGADGGSEIRFPFCAII